MWSLVAVIALVPWLLMIRGSSAEPAPTAGRRLPLPGPPGRGWRWALTIYFGTQSMVAYVVFGWLAQILTDAGRTDTAAAFQVSIAITVGIPLAAMVPPLLGRLRRPAILVVILSSCYLAAFVGLILAPSGPAVVVFSVLIGIGTGAFPLALTLIALRSRTSLATTSLSAFTQCTGYLIASVGPVGFGILFDVSGGWTVPLLVLCGVVLVQAGAGVLRSGRGMSRTNSGHLLNAGSGRWVQVGGVRSVGSGRWGQVAWIRSPNRGVGSRTQDQA